MKNANLESNIVRAVWSAVEMMNKQALLHSSDADLVQQVMERVERLLCLDFQERQSLVDYVNSKVRLIEDLVQL